MGVESACWLFTRLEYRAFLVHTAHAQFGLATVLLSVLMPLWGVVSFRRLGFIQKFPERLQPVIKVSPLRAPCSSARVCTGACARGSVMGPGRKAWPPQRRCWRCETPL